MKLSIVGASRGVGFELLKQALQAGHEVTVVVRNRNNLTINNENLTVIEGSILDKSAIEEAVSGRDAVCLTIGIGPTRKPVSVFSEGTRIVVEAMKNSSCKRLICVTGIGAGDSKNHGGFFYDKILKPLLLGTIYEDKERQEAIVRESGLDWEIVRPGFLTDGVKTGKYRILTDINGITAGKISRVDVADFILREAAEMKYGKQTPLLTY